MESTSADFESNTEINAIDDGQRGRQVSRNLAGSMLGYSPAVPALAILLALSASGRLTSVAIIFGAILSSLFAVVLAREDRSILLQRGFSETVLPSPYIASIAPWLYLWLRGNRIFSLDLLSLKPFWRHVAFTLVLLFTVFVFPTVAGIGRMLLDLH